MHKQRVKQVRKFLKEGYCPIELAIELCDSVEVLVEQRDAVYSAMYSVLKDKMKQRVSLVENDWQPPPST